jgi:hypothetical protein
MLTPVLLLLALASGRETSYADGWRKAVEEHKDLAVQMGDQRVPANLDLTQYVVVHLAHTENIDGRAVHDYPCFQELGGNGVALIFLSDPRSGWFGRVYHTYPGPNAKEAGPKEALHEVNAGRTARGLYPYIEDPNLTVAARRLALTRAAYLIEGHLANDFAAVPPGSYARATGCAAWPAWMGWGSCAAYDVGYHYAGAAWHMGRDGRRYMHLVLR